MLVIIANHVTVDIVDIHVEYNYLVITRIIIGTFITIVFQSILVGTMLIILLHGNTGRLVVNYSNLECPSKYTVYV